MKSLRSAIFAALGALFFSPTSLSEKYTYSSLSRNSFEAQELSSISVFHLSCFDSLHKVSERLSVKLLIESWWHKGATAMQSTTNRGGTFFAIFFTTCHNPYLPSFYKIFSAVSQSQEMRYNEPENGQ